jgi:beta-lactamase superfamily II metal-dependent hydrolase
MQPHARRATLPAKTVIIGLLILVSCAIGDAASPPNYKSFGRKQDIKYRPDPNELMSIWIAYVAQGDGLLIQLPRKYNYNRGNAEAGTETSERIDILIDGGPHKGNRRSRMESFLLELYESPVTIEHAVITHHDADHVEGLTDMLSRESVGIESIYHNGLASYRIGVRNFEDDTGNDVAVVKHEKKKKSKSRGMAFFDQDAGRDGDWWKLDDNYLIDTKAELKKRLKNDELHEVYENLARAVIDKKEPIRVQTFRRCSWGKPFINERESEIDRGVDLEGITFKLLWPLEHTLDYGDWGKTINGNSLTFRLDYGDFSMLFTGDHNGESEKKLVKRLGKKNRLAFLDVDVLKVPHHGSKDGYLEFFQGLTAGSQGRRIRSVLSVASMGKTGLATYGHPSSKIVRWLGGPHRVYHTLIHEKTFTDSDTDSKTKREKMCELSHILIETDGKWFRVVEVHKEGGNVNAPPTVPKTGRSHGTRWIQAK